MLDNISIQFTVTFTGWQTCFWSLSRLLSVKSKFIVRNIFFRSKRFLFAKTWMWVKMPLAEIVCSFILIWTFEFTPFGWEWCYNLDISIPKHAYTTNLNAYKRPIRILRSLYFQWIINAVIVTLATIVHRCMWFCPALWTHHRQQPRQSFRCFLVWFCAETHLRKYINYHKICTPFAKITGKNIPNR